MACLIHATSVTTAIRSQRERCSIPMEKSSQMAPGLYAGEVGSDLIVEAQLWVGLERRVDGGDQHRLIVASRHMTTARDSYDVTGKSAQLRDHGAYSQKAHP